MGIAQLSFPALCAAAILVAGCSTTHEFRVASVGDEGAVEIISEPVAPVIVASAGNAPLLPAMGMGLGQPVGSSGIPLLPAANPVAAGPTIPLTEPGSTGSLPTNGTGATIGEFVSVDLPSTQISASMASLGSVDVSLGGQSNILDTSLTVAVPNVGGTSLAIAIANPLPAISTIALPVLAPVKALSPTVATTLQPVNSAVGAATGTVTNVTQSIGTLLPLCC